ncbi:MAG: T9SS type A sorting domain-containing protein [Bacteroidia bacterium]
MKYLNYLLFSVLFFSVIMCTAQDHSLAVIKSSGENNLYSVTSDDDENIYVLGSGIGVDFGNAVVTTSSEKDEHYVAQINSKGEFIWVSTFGTSSSYHTNLYKLRVGQDNNLYICGDFHHAMHFGNFNVSATNGAGTSRGSFIAKLDKKGVWKWAQSIRSTNYKSCSTRSAQGDKFGNCYVVGEFNRNARFGATTLTTKGQYATFVAKLDPNGNWLWAASTSAVDDRSNTRPIALDINSKEEVYILGKTANTTVFGADTLNSSTSRHFISGLDSSGKWIETIPTLVIGNNGSNQNGDLIIDKNDNVYITGTFSSAIVVGSDTLYQGHSSFYNGYVAKFTPRNGWIWAKSASSNQIEGQCNNISIDDENNIYITGFTSNGRKLSIDNVVLEGRYLMKLNSTGEIQRVHSLYTSENMEFDPTDMIAISPRNVVFIGSSGEDITYFGKTYKIDNSSSFIGYVQTRTASTEYIGSSVISIYPNPTKGTFSIINSDIERLFIYDTNGRVQELKPVKIGNEYQVSLPDCNGFYILEVHSSDGRIQRKKITKY